MTLSKPNGRRAPTIYDVAKLAGVSHQTVSRYIKGATGVSPATRARVEAALTELDYQINMTARSLATSQSHRIGALTYEMSQIGPSRIMQSAADEAREAGYVVDIVSLGLDPDTSLDEAITLLNRRDFAGVLAISPTDQVRQTLLKVPFVVPLSIQSETEEVDAGHPESLNGEGARIATEHLLELGHTRIMHISGPHGWLAARNRLHAFEAALQERGLAPALVAEGDWSPASGYTAVMTMPLDAGITAIFAANDQMALGALRALAERGISVPGQLSVVGFDNIPESAYLIPPLTTVELDFDRQGRYAMSKLLAAMGVRAEPGEGDRARAVLVVRSSSSAPSSASTPASGDPANTDPAPAPAPDAASTPAGSTDAAADLPRKSL